MPRGEHNAKCDDETFIRLWKETGGSPTEISRITGINVRNVQARRRRLEAVIGQSMPAGRSLSMMKERHGAILKMDVEDGIVIVASDAHYWPGERTTAQRALPQFVRALKPKVLVMNGDVFDGARISRHPAIGFLEDRPSVVEELKACESALTELEEAAGPSCRLVWPLGNHDLRFESFLAANAPEYQGVQGFHLKDRFPLWHPCWTLWLNERKDGWTEIKHRMKGGIHATWNNVASTAIHTVTGHLHAMNVRPRENRYGTRFGVDCGTLADTDGAQFVHYTEANQTDWRSGFVVLTYRDGRLLMPELVMKWDEEHVQFRGGLVHVP